MKFSKVHLAVIFLILANIIWGGGPPIFKWALEDVPTFTLAFLRYFIPAVIIIVLFPHHLIIDKKDLPKLLLTSFLGIIINIGLYFLALHYTASINAAIIACAGPAFLIILSMLFLKERPTRKMLLGNLIGLTGVLLIILESGSGTNGKFSVLGNLLLVFSTIGAVANTILVKELIKKYHPITLIFWIFMLGSIMFYPFVAWESYQNGFLSHLNLQGILGIIYGAFFTSFFAWFVLFWALKYVSASDTAIFDYVQPPVSILIAMPLVHEVPTVFFLIGSLLVLGGMYVAENHKSHPHIHHLLRK